VGVNEDLLDVQEYGCLAMQKMQGVMEDPVPFMIVEDLGDSNVLVRFFGWVDQRNADFAKVRGEAIRRVKLALDEAGSRDARTCPDNSNGICRRETDLKQHRNCLMNVDAEGQRKQKRWMCQGIPSWMNQINEELSATSRTESADRRADLRYRNNFIPILKKGWKINRERSG
jgi:hypothetical protein